jgi:hypothetical protein
LRELKLEYRQAPDSYEGIADTFVQLFRPCAAALIIEHVGKETAFETVSSMTRLSIRIKSEGDQR